MTSGTSLVGIATFEQTTHAACVAKLLGRSPETATPEDLCRIKVHPRDSGASHRRSTAWSLR